MKIIKTIVIPGECISKKRAIQPIKKGLSLSIGKTKVWKKYENMAFIYLSVVKPLPLETNYPVYIHIWHYRKTKQMFDYLNMAQGIHDVLQGNMKTAKDFRHSIIPEDNVNYVIPVHDGPFAGWSVDKKNPRSVITITDDPWKLAIDETDKKTIMKMIEEYQTLIK